MAFVQDELNSCQSYLILGLHRILSQNVVFPYFKRLHVFMETCQRL